MNGYKHNIFSAVKRLFTGKSVVIRYAGDAGVVKGKNSHYSIAVLTIMKTRFPWRKFPMKELAKRVHAVMENI